MVGRRARSSGSSTGARRRYDKDFRSAQGRTALDLRLITPLSRQQQWQQLQCRRAAGGVGSGSNGRPAVGPTVGFLCSGSTHQAGLGWRVGNGQKRWHSLDC